METQGGPQVNGCWVLAGMDDDAEFPIYFELTSYQKGVYNLVTHL